MKRNLLPLFRSDSGIGKANRGEWTHLQQRDHLGRLDFGKQKKEEAFHSRIQSIPSPWARLVLFRNALEEVGHPARELVTSEWLDALEFVWGLQVQQDLPFQTETIALEDLRTEARRTDSARVQDFSEALVSLVPQYRRGGSLTSVRSVTLGLVNQRPVLMSSPYTLFATAEDAGRWVKGELFRFGDTGRLRRLRDRPREFQRYVAMIVRPQIMAGSQDNENAEVEWGLATRLLGDWLKGEIAACEGLSSDSVDPRWADAARGLRLEASERIGAFRFFRLQGGDIESRWRLVTSRGKKPLVLVRDQFDGHYFANAPRIKPATELRGLDRKVLPGTSTIQDWVSPEHDWFTPQLMLLNQPIDLTRVKWLKPGESYTVMGADSRRFGQPRALLPLTGSFFEYFGIDEALAMLTLEARAGGVIAKLRIPVGSPDAPEMLEIKRDYAEQDIRTQGPELALWPAFAHPSWREYLVFRTDTARASAKWMRLEGRTEAGERIPGRIDCDRTPLARTVSFDEPPAILELISVEEERERSLGVLFPAFRALPDIGEHGAVVGIDFGTSNTVIAMRDQNGAERIIGFEELTSNLTQPGAEQPDLIASFFFPESIAAEPFGTAVLHVTSLSGLDIEKDRVGLRVNTPFTGYVDSSRDPQSGKYNKVVGDLKWSTTAVARFLSASFLRHLASLVVARALNAGIPVPKLEFRWSYPRAFTETDVSHLTRLWADALTNVPWRPHEQGRRVAELRTDAASLDESQSVLRYFFGREEVSTQGADAVVLDVGGGTTDIAIYGGGAPPILDSVMLGGRNLTGQRLHGGDQAANPFVLAFVQWAEQHGLPQRDADVLHAYVDDGQVHLAFSYLVASPWFSTGQAAVFAAREEFHLFQACVFYFFGALSYYAGLSVRTEEAPRVPLKVVFAGNGRRYLDWLTGLAPARAGDRFQQALAALLVRAAGAPDSPSPGVILSEKPKTEVALGLITAAEPKLPGKPITGSVAGEHVRMGIGQSPQSERKEFQPGDRMGPKDFIVTGRINEIEWLGDRMEIERYHDALLEVCDDVAAAGAQWRVLRTRYEEIFRAVDRRVLQNATKARIEFLTTTHDAYRGSIFILEASMMLEHMLRAFFPPPAVPQYAPGSAVPR